MPTVVKTRLIKIGNSQGIRIPKLLLEQSRIGEEVELKLERNQIVVCAVHPARRHWEDAFKAMGERGDDGLLDGEVAVSTSWDEEEWEW